MLVTVIIKRDIREGQEKEFFSHLKNLRIKAMNQKGYFSGETLLCAENTNKVAVISKWQTLEDWNNWKTSAARLEMDATLSKFQSNPTIYEPYVFSKYKAAAKQGFPAPLDEQYL
jgi:heme-degrading monooxygenase HmoA